MSIEHSTRDPGRTGEESYVVTVRKARIGWWVDGRWCPTHTIQQHEIRRILAARPEPVVIVGTQRWMTPPREGSTGNGDHPAGP